MLVSNNQAPIMALTLLAAAAQAQLLSGLNVTGRLNCPPKWTGHSWCGISLNCTNLFGGTGQGVDGRFNITCCRRCPYSAETSFRAESWLAFPSTKQCMCPILNTVNGVVSAVPTLITTVVNGLTVVLVGIFGTLPFTIITS